MNARKYIIALATLSALGIVSAQAQVRITEVDANGSSTGAAYGADWFELANFGSSVVDLSGWKMDDNTASSSLAVALRTSSPTFNLAPGQIMVFLEDGTDPSDDAALGTAFQSAWGSSLPSNLTLNYYGGSGVGLGSSGDQVNIFDNTGALVTKVTFGTSTLAGGTFDNSAGLDGVTLTQFSSVGVNGAFASANSGEVGSPGLVPEPSSLALFATGATLFGMFYRRKK